MRPDEPTTRHRTRHWTESDLPWRAAASPRTGSSPICPLRQPAATGRRRMPDSAAASIRRQATGHSRTGQNHEWNRQPVEFEFEYEVVSVPWGFRFDVDPTAHVDDDTRFV